MKDIITQGLFALSFSGALVLPSSTLFATLEDKPLGVVPGVHRHDAEIQVLGDFDADGEVDDWILIDRKTGMANIVSGGGLNSTYTYAGYANYEYLYMQDWQRFYVGLGNVDDATACALEAEMPYGPMSSDVHCGLAVTSSSANRIVVTLDPDDSGRNYAAAAVGRVMNGIGPKALVAQGLSDEGAASGDDSLYVYCESNEYGGVGPVMECLLDPASSAETVASSLEIVNEQWRDFECVFGPDYFYAMRDQSDETEVLLVKSGPVGENLEIVKSLSGLAEGSQMTFGAFSGTDGQVECIFWAPEKTSIRMCVATTGGFGDLTDFDLEKEPEFICAMSGAPVFVAIFKDGTAASYYWEGSGDPYRQQPFGTAKSGSYTGIITHAEGSMALLEGENGISTSLRQFAILQDNTGFFERETKVLPQHFPTGSRSSVITAEAYDGDPFDPDDAHVIEAFRLGDWSTGYFNSTNGFIGIFGLSFYEDEGLKYPFSSYMNITDNFEDLLYNQVSDSVSAYLGEGPVGPVGPVVSIDPAPQTGLTSPVTPELVSTQSNCVFYYRLNGASKWELCTDGKLPMLIDDTDVEAFGKTTYGVPGGVEHFAYRFAVPSGERDSDNDGVPDAIEAEYGLDPASGPDYDGDGVTDLVEIDYESEQGHEGVPLVSDPYAYPPVGDYPESGYPVAYDSVGQLDLNINVSPTVARFALSREKFSQEETVFDRFASGVLAGESVEVQDVNGNRLGITKLSQGVGQAKGVIVGRQDRLMLVGTGRSTEVGALLKPSFEGFEHGNGTWTKASGSSYPVKAYPDASDGYYLEVTDLSNRLEIHNQSEAWTGDLLAAGVGGLSMRVCNLDPVTKASVRVVLVSESVGKEAEYWCSRKAELLASAKMTGAPGNPEAWHQVVFPFDMPEAFTDSNGNSRWDEGEAFEDVNEDDVWDAGSFVLLQGQPDFEQFLAHVDRIIILNSTEPAVESTEKLTGLGLDDLYFTDAQSKSARMMAAIAVPEFGHEFVPYVEQAGNSLEENIAHWNSLRKQAWDQRAEMDVSVDVASTLSYVLTEYALELALGRLDGKVSSKRLGLMREGVEVLPVTGRELTVDDHDADAYVLLSSSQVQQDDVPEMFLSHPIVELDEKSLGMAVEFAKDPLERSAVIEFDEALQGEFFTVNVNDGIVYRGVFDPDAKQVEIMDTPEGLSQDELAYLYFPSFGSAYAPSSSARPLAVDPKEVLSVVTELVAESFEQQDPASELAKLVYGLNSAFGGRSSDIYEDPVRALRGFVREGISGLGGPDVMGSPAWRDGLTTLGFEEDDFITAKARMDKIVNLAMRGRSQILSEPMTIVAGDESLHDRIEDTDGVSVQLLDKHGDPFPLPENFPLNPGTIFNVTGYALPNLASGARAVQVVSLDLIHLPRAEVVDTDNDLLDDRWEMLHFYTLGWDGFMDNDDDGYNNVEEFVQGTDPLWPTDTPGENGKKLGFKFRLKKASNGNIEIHVRMDPVFLNNFSFNPQVSSHPVQNYVDQVPAKTYTENGEQVVEMSQEDFKASFYRLFLGLQ